VSSSTVVLPFLVIARLLKVFIFLIRLLSSLCSLIATAELFLARRSTRFTLLLDDHGKKIFLTECSRTKLFQWSSSLVILESC